MVELTSTSLSTIVTTSLMQDVMCLTLLCREAPVVSSRNAARQVAAAPMDDGRAAELDTLAALCPFDVAADREYLAHVLSVHGLEVGDLLRRAGQAMVHHLKKLPPALSVPQ